MDPGTGANGIQQWELHRQVGMVVGIDRENYAAFRLEGFLGFFSRNGKRFGSAFEIPVLKLVWTSKNVST